MTINKVSYSDEFYLRPGEIIFNLGFKYQISVLDMNPFDSMLHSSFEFTFGTSSSDALLKLIIKVSLLSCFLLFAGLRNLFFYKQNSALLAYFKVYAFLDLVVCNIYIYGVNS